MAGDSSARLRFIVRIITDWHAGMWNIEDRKPV
jgi:hypothetical protein